jgi:cytoskeletal protein CcmA (bactofilin family)
MFTRSTKDIAPAASGTVVASSKKTVPSVISADMHVLGNIISEGALDIDGKIEGNIKCHTATIRPNGRVLGDIEAQQIHVHGNIEGVIKSKAVALYASANVQGTIMHESLTIEQGAVVDGKFKRTDKIFIEDPVVAARAAERFDNDNHEPATPEEAKLLENLRLIS